MSAVAGRRLLMIEQGGRGGVADYTAELTRALAEQGWAVTLATAADHRYQPTPGVTYRPVFHYVRDGTPIGRVMRRRGLARVVNGIRFLLAIPRLTRLARGADVVHTQGWEIPQIGLLAIACLRLTGTPIVQTAHGTFERANAFLRTRLLVRRLSGRLVSRTIVHTRADLTRVAKWVGPRATVIAHGEYGGLARTGGGAGREASRSTLGIVPDAAVTLMFGQLRPDKGLEDLVEAARKVPSLHLLIGGADLGGLTNVKTQLEDAELRERVTVREGFLDMTEAARLFAAADTVALPYRAASQSGVLLLAYGFSRPVIVYPAESLVESVIEGETGWICARSDADALADALAASVAAGWEECRRRGEAGARLARERFAWPVIARHTGELYEEAVASR